MKKPTRTLLWACLALCIVFYVVLYRNYSTPILMYHSIDRQRTDTYAAVSKDSFEKQMTFIKEAGYTVLSLNDYCASLAHNKPIARNTVIITFDDGYKDNLKAAAILEKFGFAATIFISPSKIGLPGYLTRADIAEITEHTKITFGSHTLTHAYLPRIAGSQLTSEIVDSKKHIEAMTGRPVEAISYPSGGFDQRVIDQASAAGYLCGCTTNRGFSNALNRFALRRIKITNRDRTFSLWAKLSGFYTIFKKAKKPN